MNSILHGVLRPGAYLRGHLRPTGCMILEISRITQETGESESLVMSQAAVTKELTALSKAKLDADQGTHNAGRLLYVGTDGSIVPLELGAGLSIIDGRLCLTEAPDPEETVLFAQTETETAEVSVVTFSLQEDGSVLWSGGVFVPGEEETVYIQ